MRFVGEFQNCESDYNLSHVCPSVRSEKLGFHWTDFHGVWYLTIFRKSAERIKVSLKSDNNNWYFTWRPIYILSYLAQFFQEWEKFQASVVQKIKTHISCSIFLGNSAVFEIMWKNIAEPERPQMTIWSIHLRTPFPLCYKNHTCIQYEYITSTQLVQFSLVFYCIYSYMFRPHYLAIFRLSVREKLRINSE
jgi:hypothetical protein